MAKLQLDRESIDASRLIKRAREAAKNSYSPYSHFPVGAAVLTAKGNIYAGANVENASYGLTICAERVAICKAVSEGDKDITAIAISAPNNSTPCGACRQFIYEFGERIKVYIETTNNTFPVERTISELLPSGFSKQSLK
jgi:cytidine deaminase